MSEQDVQNQAKMEGLATLLVLNDEIKKITNLREFAFFSTNETHRLIPYQTAYLWEKRDILGVQLIAQSGTAEWDPHTAVNHWLRDNINTILEKNDTGDIQSFNTSDFTPMPQDARQQKFAKHFLWCPFADKEESPSGGLIFFRDIAFTDDEVKMLRWLITSYRYTWKLLIKPKKSYSWQTLKKKPYFNVLIVALLVVVLFPVRLSAIGTATVIANNPSYINAPMQGIIRSFAVSPGQTVKKGQLLVSLDKTDLLASVKVGYRDYSLTEAKLRTTINAAFTDKARLSEVPILQAQLAIDKARLDFTNELLEKTDIKSPIDGIVIFDSAEDWLGQPVQTGERILSVANPHQLKLQIYLPIEERIQLKVDGDGYFFMYGRLTAIPIKITKLGYNAKLLPNKILAYELIANFTDTDNIPQIGVQGTVKLYGDRVPLFYYFIRRPLQSIRHLLGI